MGQHRLPRLHNTITEGMHIKIIDAGMRELVSFTVCAGSIALHGSRGNVKERGRGLQRGRERAELWYYERQPLFLDS